MQQRGRERPSKMQGSVGSYLSSLIVVEMSELPDEGPSRFRFSKLVSGLSAHCHLLFHKFQHSVWAVKSGIGPGKLITRPGSSLGHWGGGGWGEFEAPTMLPSSSTCSF